ncbi:hypothetical protein RHMOL_Rhmol06G0181400 [Rhododendron molle]|uniref:Uncharacterized protein n=1 Tax=Rhododendron molle TaxID=49168 RepID=A0ACC0NDU2_RHOML|nr:hypothetical protein RHMOL_Rhmol06G0181400 [Rhododendron molle]
MKGSLAATVYAIWRERNYRVFQQKSLPADRVVQTTINSIRAFLSSTKGALRTLANRLLCATWGLSERSILLRWICFFVVGV